MSFDCNLGVHCSSLLFLRRLHDCTSLAFYQILKKICDHPLLLTKRAAEDVLEGMDSMANPDDVGMAEKLATHIADIGEIDGFQETPDEISCKIPFIISLLVGSCKYLFALM